MTETKQVFVAIGVAAAVAVGAAVAMKEDQQETRSIVATYARDDGTGKTKWVEVTTDAVTGAETEKVLPESPCRCRPKGMALDRCSKVCRPGPHGEPQPKGPCDPGEENRMLPGDFVDNGGCEQCACTVIAGVERRK